MYLFLIFELLFEDGDSGGEMGERLFSLVEARIQGHVVSTERLQLLL